MRWGPQLCYLNTNGQTCTTDFLTSSLKELNSFAWNWNNLNANFVKFLAVFPLPHL